MDKTTTAICLEQWANIFREWSASGLTKKDFVSSVGSRRSFSSTISIEFGISWLSSQALLRCRIPEQISLKS